MRKSFAYKSLALFLIVMLIPSMIQSSLAQAQAAATAAQSKPAIAIRVLVQSPAETDTEMQIICLFESVPDNTLHGSLVETNEKLKGLLDKVRTPTSFRGELGETILIFPPAGSLAAKKLLIIGLGDSQTFTPQRMELVGSIAYNESNRLGVAHPFFAPTILDGGVTKFATGQVAERFVTGFLRAAGTEKSLEDAGASKGQVIQGLTFLAGAAHAADTQKAIDKAFAATGK
jgi:Cytosol aminopeptidase family, N-terminal domain